MYYSVKTTEIPLRKKKKANLSPQTQKMVETPLPPKKWLKYPRSKKNNWNIIEAYKKTTIPLNYKKKTKIGRNIIHYSFKND